MDLYELLRMSMRGYAKLDVTHKKLDGWKG